MVRTVEAAEPVARAEALDPVLYDFASDFMQPALTPESTSPDGVTGMPPADCLEMGLSLYSG